MDDSLGARPRSGLTDSARKRMLISIWISVPIFGLAIAAMVGRGISAARSGDEFTASSIFISGTVVGSLGIAVVVGMVIYLMRRVRRIAYRFEVLKAAYPDSLTFMVGYTTLNVSAPLPGWAGLKVSKVHGIVVNGPKLTLVRISEGAESLVTVHDADCEVSIGTRNMSGSDMVQVEFIARSGDMRAKLGVLPVNVRRFSSPSFESLNDLVAAVRSEMTRAEERGGG